MLFIIGYVVVVASVFGGYLMHGGDPALLFQPSELIIIGGGALGAFVAGNSGKVVKAVMQRIPELFKGSKYTKALYTQQLTLLYELLTKIRREGLMSIESDVEDPGQSALFKSYPDLVSDHHFMEFLTDYARLMVSGNLNPMEIETLMDQELETHHHEMAAPADAVQTVADGLPAFGIVAAVMGVVNVMSQVGQPPAVLGKLIGAALVGTFIGILLAYGFVSPIASIFKQKTAEQSKQLECVKVVLLASLNGYAPSLAIEFGRKILFSTDRPSFLELEDAVKNRK